MKKTLLLVLACIVSIHYSFSQEVNIKVGSEIKTKTELITMVGEFGDRIVGVFNHKKKYFLKSYNKNLGLINTKELNLEYKGKKLRYSNAAKLNNRMFIFAKFTNKKAKKNYLLYKEINPKTFKSVSKLKVIGEIPYENRRDNGFFGFEYSKDNKLLLLFHYIPTDENENEKIALKVLDSDLNLKWKKNITIPYKSELTDIIDYNLDLEGNVYVVVKKYKHKREDIINKKINFTYTILTYKNSGNDNTKIDLSLKNKYITQLKIAIDESQNIFCSGFYSNNISHKSERDMGLGGSFYMKIENDDNEVSISTTNDFTLEFISSLLSKRKKEKMKKKSKKKKKKGQNLEMSNYYLDELYLNDDGSIILVGEKAYSITHTVSNGQGGYTTTTTYYYQNIIAVEYDSEGDVKWVRRVPKFQSSSSTYYLSYASIVNNENIYFIYNDHIENTHIKNEVDYKPFSLSYKKTNIVAYRIDGEGNTKYINLHSTAKLGAMLVPTASTLIRHSNDLYLYIGRGKKERIARLYFNE